MQNGDELSIGPPCGEFTLDTSSADGKPIVMLAGGIGVTPLLSMLKALAKDFDISRLLRSCISEQPTARAGGEVRDVASQHPAIQTHFRYDAPLADDLSTGRCDSIGRVDLEFLQTILPTNDAQFYFCGPKPFMTGVYRALKDWYVDESRIHFEFFGPRQEINGVN